MRPSRLLTNHKEQEIFDRAVRDSAIALVTIRSEDGWSTFKCRFLERDPQGSYFVLDHQSSAGETLPILSLGQYVGVNFRHGSRKIMFSTVVEAKGKFLMPDNREIAAIRYRWPDALTELQRRAFYRTAVPPGMVLIANLWPGGAERRAEAQRSAGQVVSGQLIDLSCGGALIEVHQQTTPPWTENQTLGIDLQLGDGKPSMAVDGHFKGFRAREGTPSTIAIQFVGFEMSVEGQVNMQRLSHAVQRLHRIGAATANVKR